MLRLARPEPHTPLLELTLPKYMDRAWGREFHPKLSSDVPRKVGNILGNKRKIGSLESVKERL